MRAAAPDPLAQPWWRSGYLWLIIGLTLAAVVASGVTLYLAMQVPALPAVPAQEGATAAHGQGDALEPALQARNRTSSRNARAMGAQRGPSRPEAGPGR